MAYSDFNDAFTDFSNFFAGVKNEMTWFEVDLATILTAGNVPTLRLFVHNTLIHLRNAFIAHVCPGGFTADYTGSAHYMSTYFASEEPPTGDVTMEAMLSAMVAAEPEEVTYWVGLEDAFRTAVWDAPYNEEFFAALARGFSDKWP